jgi:16S rRNA (guanine966-N2)-methyltransferase
MRIIAGKAGGRRLTVPPTGTRPTSDRVREAVFSAIDTRLDLAGTAVLDLYAGSGALGLECLSRGAAEAVLVDRDAKAAGVLKANAVTVGLAATVRRTSVTGYLAGTPRPFDVVFLDPPYDLPSPTVTADLTALTGGWLAVDALVVVERSARTEPVRWPEGFDPVVARNYGETRVEMAFWQDRQA